MLRRASDATRTFGLNGIRRQFGLADIDDTVDVEDNLLGVGDPVLIAEAVRVFAVAVGCEGMIAGRDASLVDFVATAGVQDLGRRRSGAKLLVN